MFRDINVAKIYDTNILLAIKVYNIVVLITWQRQRALVLCHFLPLEHGEDCKEIQKLN